MSKDLAFIQWLVIVPFGLEPGLDITIKCRLLPNSVDDQLFCILPQLNFPVYFLLHSVAH